MECRCRLPRALYGCAREKARATGQRVDAVVRTLLRLYVEGQIDPTAVDPIASAIAARGGRARAARLDPDARRRQAQVAARARWR